MKKTLLSLALGFSLLGSLCATAQGTPYNLTVFDHAVYYGMYEATVSEPVPAGAIRHSNSSYGKMLTEEQLASFGNTLTMTVRLNPLCDNYDRIGNVNLAFVPKGATTYVYNEVDRIEIGRFITPFMDKNAEPDEVPYVYDVDNLTRIFHDENITSQYDLWVELEVYGYQGGPGQGGAAVEIPGCAGRNDVYMGSLEFTSDTDPNVTSGQNYLVPLSFKYELKNYTLDGTDVLGETIKTITFDLETDVPDAKLYFINSNHGSNNNGEEYNRRWHYLSVDGDQVFSYRPGGVSCVPFSQYNTQPNCIYLRCDLPGSPPRADTNSAWSWNNWCPGDKIPIRVVDLGDMSAGTHTFTIEVPNAVFPQGQGYFPMSVYLQGGEVTLGAEDYEAATFRLSPNPVNDFAYISSEDKIESVQVYNNLGQKVWEGHDDTIEFYGMQSGIYLVQVHFEGNKIATRKLVKQ